MGYVKTLLMPYAPKMLNSNDSLHHMAAYRIRVALRDAAVLTLRRERLPRLSHAVIFYVLHPQPVERTRDPANWYPTAKAYIDGLVTPNPELPKARHLLPDDDAEHLMGPFPAMGAPVSSGRARMSLVIAELTGPDRLTSSKSVLTVVQHLLNPPAAPPSTRKKELP
ncbi:hypothetical protein [Streptomyces sp. NPDC002758]